MTEPLLLTLDEVLQLHEYQIQHSGGDAAVHDIALLESGVPK